MVESPLDLVGRNPAWRALLDAYRAAERDLRSSEGPPVRWVARLRGIAGIEPPDLSRAHGHMIAYGLLRFQLAGSGVATGLEYQLSPLGRQALGEGDLSADVEGLRIED